MTARHLWAARSGRAGGLWLCRLNRGAAGVGLAEQRGGLALEVFVVSHGCLLWVEQGSDEMRFGLVGF